MNGRRISPSSLSPSIGAYSPGVEVELHDRNIVFVSGQVAKDSSGATVGVGNPKKQTEKVFENIKSVLAESEMGMENIVSMIIYVTDITHFAEVSDIRDRELKDVSPSSTLVEVSSLAISDHLIEISCIAIGGTR